jgi:hypothetical protein
VYRSILITSGNTKEQVNALSCTCRNWGGQGLVDEVVMSSDISLEDDLIVVNFTMTYNGKTDHPRMSQETPAIFLHRDLSVLTLYNNKYAFKWDDDLE